MNKINKKYILEKYNLDKERQKISKEEILDTFAPDDMFLEETISSEDFFGFYDSLKVKYKDLNVKFRIEQHGWEGDFSIHVVIDTEVLETDKEVIARLKSFELKERTKRRRLEKARKLIADEDNK